MARPGIIIRSQELSGKQVVLGADAARGIVVEQPAFAADGWGSSAGSFTLKRNPRVQWPDLRALAPIIVEERGRPVWLGRIRQTPMTDGGLARQISVTCEGQQFHLDDDMYQRTYVQTDTTKWQDLRTYLGTGLTGPGAPIAFTVTAGGGQAAIGLPNGSTAAVNAVAGIFLDLGPGGLAKRIGVDFTGQSVPVGGWLLELIGATAPWNGVEEAITLLGSMDTTERYLFTTFTTTHRYLVLRLRNGTGSTATGADGITYKIGTIIVFADTAYESAGVSILKASTVITDALAQATALLSADRSRISLTSFNIPEFDMSGPATAREVINAANAYHGYQFRVRPDNVPEYRALPATPILEVGSDSRFDEASAGDASEIYARVIVQYTDPAGVAATLTANQPVTTYQLSGVQLTNPSFETNLAGWLPAGSPITRDATHVTEGAFACKLVPGAGAVISSFFTDSTVGPVITGPLVIGRRYRLVFWVYVDGAFIVGQEPYSAVFDDGGGGARITWPAVSLNTWTPVTGDFVAASKTGFGLQHNSLSTAGATSFWLDGHRLYETVPTIVDRWGIRRTKVLAANMRLTPAAAQQLADVFLAAHRTTPLKGKLAVASRGAVRTGGARVTCAELMTCTGELVRMRHLVDPETGKLGRIGRIAGVSWDAEADTATLDIDSTSSNFEALLQRLAVVTGQVRA